LVAGEKEKKDRGKDVASPDGGENRVPEGRTKDAMQQTILIERNANQAFSKNRGTKRGRWKRRGHRRSEYEPAGGAGGPRERAQWKKTAKRGDERKLRQNREKENKGHQKRLHAYGLGQDVNPKNGKKSPGGGKKFQPNWEGGKQTGRPRYHPLGKKQ